MTYTNQIQILHFSDLHFGDQHICNPDPTTSDKGIPDLGTRITDDLREDFGANFSDPKDYGEEKMPPLIAVISGDFTQQAEQKEFDSATSFLNKLLSSPLLGRSIEKSDIFMIPGNHDVEFKKETPEERFRPYCSFYNKFFRGTREPQFSDIPEGLTQVHVFEKDGNKILVAEINCCTYVEDDKINSSRGQVDMSSIDKLDAELKEIAASKNDFEDYIKIAVIHHHVVLLPSFIEPTKGVDAVVNARHLLELLSENGFHLILHGHKHYPQIFQYEPLSLWTENENRIPQLIISGGSCGSKDLFSETLKSCNTYGVITIKWHPAAKQARIHVITRGLERNGPSGPLRQGLWKWRTINITDKTMAPYNTMPKSGPIQVKKIDNDIARKDEYKKLRLHLPVVEVMPSLIPGQAYEARAWITPHRPEVNTYPALIRVEWTAGGMFPKLICSLKDNPSFCISYQYWGPMLLQAKLIFEDGYEVCGYVYARMPKQED